MSMPPTSSNPGDNGEAAFLNIVPILYMIGALPIMLFIVYFLRICCVQIFGLHLPQDIEMGRPRYLSQAAMQGQQPRQQQQQTPKRVLAGTLVTYENINQETEANCTADECAICLEEFIDRDRCMVLSKCKHMYHQRCIDRWLLDHSHCPLCRGSVHGSGSTPQNTGTA
ncbi:putative RING-H2 finger protein ATL19 [Herrania umbratica]|uniref:RING-type E3 ubiquitin transferase n=1 Tax=Herrania umbratica TaxID=108875 RepID=A0A6J0ZY69_9ROSI|nr:putative RING-H2 finger protein ATL19 [Herrania umbratica]